MSVNSSTIEGYQKIKTVGKGSFGTATLYKRLIDGALIVMKEIYLTDMSLKERRLSLNEVNILSSLNHPNIIRYMGSLEIDGSLLIMMEYANGGNLAQLINYKKDRDDYFSERSILGVFTQICSGMSYMHSNNILHRDLKPANIFLIRDGAVKIGDFGISKVMSTKSQAHTVVGTPYYLSPEMCEGKDYDEKSDVWAMGCILYELICLRKPFEASSLPMLVQKITHCEFSGIPSSYSNGLSNMITMILQVDSDDRPSAQHMHDYLIPIIIERLNATEKRRLRKFSLSSIFQRSVPRERSVLYELYGFTEEPDLYPVELPHQRIIDFSNSETHFIVLTADKKVYTWGDNACGQLALEGGSGGYKSQPENVRFFKAKNVIRCLAGDGFSLYLTESGTIFTCGDGKYGCLGHGDWKSINKPKFIESLESVAISELACGSRHVLALATNGQLFTWGSSQEGQLGLGHSQYCCKPMYVNLPNDLNILKVFTGTNASAILTTSGRVLFSGNNDHHKLGMVQVKFLKKFALFEDLREKIKDLSLGVTHTVLLGVNKRVYCLGRNNEHQCCGEFRKDENRFIIVDLNNVEKISAGITFTIATTEDNVVYFWGTHYKNKNEDLSQSGNSSSNYSSNKLLKKGIKTKLSEEEVYKVKMSVLQPTPILALHASNTNIKNGNLLWLGGISANDNSVSVLVHTTVPPPRINDGHDNQSQILENKWVSNYTPSEFELPNTPHLIV